MIVLIISGVAVGIVLGIFIGREIQKRKDTPKERELVLLKSRIREHMHWCAYDSPEIGCALHNLLYPKLGVAHFREQLRSKKLTWEEFNKWVKDTGA